ncbi:uncharacterized protein WM277_018894 [Molossus nigricans]
MTELDRSECHAEILDLELGAGTDETLGLPFWRDFFAGSTRFAWCLHSSSSVSSPCCQTTTTAQTRIFQGDAGRCGSVSSFQNPQQNTEQVPQDQLEGEAWQAAGPPRLVGLSQLCLRVPVSAGPQLTTQNPTECSISKALMFFGNFAMHLNLSRVGFPLQCSMECPLTVRGQQTSTCRDE